MAFIAIDGDTSWQDLAIAEELAISYNRRRLLFGLSTVATPTQNTKVFDFVLALQNGIEEMMGYDYFGYGDFYGWLLNSVTLSSYENQTSEPSPLTLATGMTAAGLTETGYWRRIAEGDTQPTTWTDYDATGWEYGNISDKDLAGPWLFIDLQVAMSALTRCKLQNIQQRRKQANPGFAGDLLSTELTQSDWDNSTYWPSGFRVSKTKTGSTVTTSDVTINVTESRFDIDSSFDALETDRVALIKVRDENSNYGSVATKMNFANLGVSDVSTVIGKTVSNTTSKSVSGGVLSYYCIAAEDASNILPIANDILPSSSIPSDARRDVDINFDVPCLIIDFSFE